MESNVLVTGGNRGIGLAIVKAFAQQQRNVIMACRDIASAEQAYTELGALRQYISMIAMDVSDRASIDTGLDEIASKQQHVDVLINNAAVLPDGDLLSLSNEVIDTSFAVNVTGPLHLVRQLAPAMSERGYGRIVNVSSEWGSFACGMDGPGTYGITKAALNALTVRLARDLPDCIKVNAMHPGWVKTRMGGEQAPRLPDQAAVTAYWLATLPDDGPNGEFFYDKQTIGW